MSLVRYLWKSSRTTFVLATIAGLVSGAAGAAFIVVVNQALESTGSGATAMLVGAYIVLSTVTVLARFVSQTLLFRLSQGVIRDLRRNLVDSILRAPLRSVEQTGTPRLYSTLSDDVVVIADALPGLPAVASSAAFVVVSIAYLTVVSPIVAAVSLMATVVGVLIYSTFARYGLRHLESARRRQDKLFEFFRAVTDGIKELKLNRDRRATVADRGLDQAASDYRRDSVRGLTIYEAAADSGQGIFFALVGLLIFVAPTAFDLSAETLVASVLVILFTVSSLQGMLTWLPAVARAAVALGQIDRQLTELRSVEAEQQPSSDEAFSETSAIEFRGVTHAYPGPAGEQFTLGPLDFSFHRGEVLFIVGANGSGKTTLAKVLTGLYRPEQGTILVDDEPVTDATRDAYRQQFSAVFSDFFLFDHLPGEVDGRQLVAARSYLTRLKLEQKVTLDGGRLSTTALSQGQRKRLALLSAFMEDREFYVFDEWAADQDPIFKRFFYDELLAELKARNKGVIVISHDDRFFHIADRRVRLEDGQMRVEVNGEPQWWSLKTAANETDGREAEWRSR